MTMWIVVFSMIFNISLFGTIVLAVIKKIKSADQKPNANSFFSKPKEKEVKKVDEVFGDIEDVWAKFD